MWDGRLDRVLITKHRNELASTDIWRIKSAPYREVKKELEFVSIEINKMLQMNDVDVAQSELASSNMLDHKKDWPPILSRS